MKQSSGRQNIISTWTLAMTAMLIFATGVPVLVFFHSGPQRAVWDGVVIPRHDSAALQQPSHQTEGLEQNGDDH